MTLRSKAKGHGSVAEGVLRFRRGADSEIAVRGLNSTDLSGKEMSRFLSAMWGAAEGAPRCHQREDKNG